MVIKLKKYIGKKVKVKILKLSENRKYYISKIIEQNIQVYIENTGDFYESELINTIVECIVIGKVKGRLIGIILSDRKFINEMKKIQKDIINKEKIGNINNIYLLKKLMIQGEIVGLYLVEQGRNNRYFLGTTEIGKQNKGIEDKVLIKHNTIENEMAKQIKDIVKKIDITKCDISLKKEIEKEKRRFEEFLNLDKSRMITRMVTLNLRQKINIKRQQEEISKKKQLENNIFSKGIEKEYSKENDVNIKQQMDMTDKVTDMKNLGQILESNGKVPNVEGKNFVKLGIIESDQKDNLLNSGKEEVSKDTTRYSFVAIADDGTTIPLDMEKDHEEGNNPEEITYNVNQKGEVEQHSVLSRFKLGEGTLAIKNGEYGEIKVYHSPRKTIGGEGLEGNKSLDIELETDNVWEIKKEERDLSAEYSTGYRSVEEGYKEAKLHEDETGKIKKEDIVKTPDIDGDMNTKSHEHIDYNKLATKWGYYKEGVPNSEKAQKMFMEKAKENPDIDEKQIIKMIDEELEEQISHSRYER